MFDFKLIFITGTIFNSIVERIKQIEGMHLGILIHSLRYKDKNEGDEKKKDFFEGLKKEILAVNKDISLFNKLIRFRLNRFANIDKIEPIPLSAMKKIIYAHKGDLSNKADDFKSYASSLFADDDSASSLSRKNTILKLYGVLLITKQSISNFVKSLDSLKEPYGKILQKKIVRDLIKNEVEKSISCYSIGLTGEAILIIGRILEKLSGDYLIKLRKEGKADATLEVIKKADFHTRINLLKKYNAISPSQFSKIMAIKWDRNIFGHPSTQVNVRLSTIDAKATISIGCSLIEFFEKKLNKK